jgi:hypothetical protein
MKDGIIAISSNFLAKIPFNNHINENSNELRNKNTKV